MARGFIVQGVEIEGFKGFTSSKAIDFEGSHVFLLGRNGNGKSSIVEAVRWGLFGSAFRPNEVVKNQRYAGNCRVTIKLMRDGEPWTLRRTLNLGTGGRSDPVLTDQNGNRRLIGDVMPQLDSVDAGEGMHIIFASQSAPLRRQPEDLDPFERTVFNYLGLTHPRVLLSNIKDFLKEQTEAEHKLDEELTKARNRIDGQIEDQQSRRRSILNVPPWGDGSVPSISASEQKARDFIKEVTGKPSDLVGLSLEALLESADTSLGETRTQGQGSLEGEAKELAGTRARLETLRGRQIQATEQEATVQSIQSDLEALLGDLTIDELRERLDAAKEQATTEAIKERIVENALVLIGRGEAEIISCPVCDSHHNRHDLKSALEDTSSDTKDDISSMVAALEAQIQQFETLHNRLKAQEAQLSGMARLTANAMSLVDDEDKRNLDVQNSVDQLIQDYIERESAVKSQLDNQEKWFREKRAQLGPVHTT